LISYPKRVTMICAAPQFRVNVTFTPIGGANVTFTRNGTRGAGRGRLDAVTESEPLRDEFEMALVAEATKKSGLIWLRIDDSAYAHAAWHVWLDGAAYVVCGGAEQPLRGIEAAQRVLVTVPSKDKGGRLVTWVARPHVVEADSPLWTAAAAALHAKRLNARDGEEQPARWARESRIVRLEPTGDVLERPGVMPTRSQAAPPRPTKATTSGPLPFVIGRATGRGRRRPPRFPR